MLASDLAGTGELADVPDMDMMDFWIPDIRKCPVGKLCGESQASQHLFTFVLLALLKLPLYLNQKHAGLLSQS